MERMMKEGTNPPKRMEFLEFRWKMEDGRWNMEDTLAGN
jgi:hypothetical protein